VANRNKERLNSLTLNAKDDCFQQQPQHSAIEFGNYLANESHMHSDAATPPSPPTLILSPLMANKEKQAGKQTTPAPVPLLINTSLTTAASSNNNNNNSQTPTSLSNNTSFLSNGSSVIKKRVWTPVQSSSNFSKSNDLNGSGNGNFNEVLHSNQSK
jgi:hypothetical protein